MTPPTEADGPRRVVVLGALSAVAEAAARMWAERGARLLLVARDEARLNTIAADLRLRGADVETLALDLSVADARPAFDGIAARMGWVDIVLVAYGVLGDQRQAEARPAEAQRILATNFTSAAGWCLAAANLFERQRGGALIVIGSVAGDRGRASNYVYAASKAGLAVLVEGIAHRLSRNRARAFLIKPGFIDTPMTAHLPKKRGVWAKPKTVARVIVRASERSAWKGPVIYVPGYWRLIMWAIRLTPSFILHRTRL